MPANFEWDAYFEEHFSIKDIKITWNGYSIIFSNRCPQRWVNPIINCSKPSHKGIRENMHISRFLDICSCQFLERSPYGRPQSNCKSIQCNYAYFHYSIMRMPLDCKKKIDRRSDHRGWREAGCNKKFNVNIIMHFTIHSSDIPRVWRLEHNCGGDARGGNLA